MFPPEHPTNHFLEILKDCYFYQHVRKPTRFRLGCEPSVLDLVITNEEGMISNMNFLPGLGASDHLIIRFTVACYTTSCVQKCRKPCYYRANYEEMRHQTSLLPWYNIEGVELQTAYNRFQDNIADLTESCIPKSKVTNARNLYMNAAALRLRKKKRELWAQYRRSEHIVDYVRYTHSRNQLRKMTRALRKSFEEKLVKDLKNQPKAFWKYTNSRIKTKAGIDALRTESGALVNRPRDKADILNMFFSSVFIKEDLTTLPSMENSHHDVVDMPEDPITSQEVSRKLRALRTTGAPGPDAIHPRVLQELAPQIVVPLTDIFNKSLSTSCLPMQWRQATVVPIHKKGDRERADNYRPISLTSVVCKTVEAILRDRIMDHLKACNLLSPHQHGFRSARSCTTQLIEAMDEWTQALEDGEAIDAVYLDFSKAFDSVPHARLLLKLKTYGIKGKMLGWIQAFLSDRIQQVLVEGERSDWCKVTSGVPQGSVLGPLLFLLYINDLPDSLESHVKIFADDSKLYHRVKTDSDRRQVQNDLDKLQNWSARWQLRFNVDKCSVLHIGSRNPFFKYSLFGRELADVAEEKDLGIVVDRELKFHRQAAVAASKANQILGVIRRSFASLTTQSLPVLYKTLVRPHLEYGNRVWGPMAVGDQILLERVQRRATKLVTEIRMKTYSQRLQELKLPSLSYRRLRGDMILLYQILHGLVEVDQGLLELPTELRTRGHGFKLSKPRATSLPRRQFSSVRTINKWNSLPASVVAAGNINSFKSRLDSHWRDQQYLSVFDP